MKALPTSVRLSPETKAALEKAAKDDERSISLMVERICREWLQANGYLPKP